jgi:hypothetical protein
VAGTLLNVHNARAAGFSVTDCTSETGPGTIGQAISDATADAGTSETIAFACGAGSHSIPLTTPLSVAMPGKTLTINGGGVITLDGGSSTQLLLITSSAGTTLEHLTLAHGQAPNATPTGGALLVSGSDLTLTGDTFTNNNASGDAAHDAKGGALYMTGGTLTVQTSTFKHNGAIDTTIGRSAHGGALYYTGSGMVTITGSTFNDNTAQAQAVAYGGAIASFASATIGNSTFTGNSATIAGGSSSSAALGGAIYGVTLIFRNDTLAGDSASAPGAGASGGELYYNPSAGGPSPRLSIANTILAHGTTNGVDSNCGGDLPPDDEGYNIDSSMSCHFDTFIHTHDLTNLDPLLSPLANNGGPTETMALTAGSQAIDDGLDANCAAALVGGVDQRGHPRPEGAHCDIGAYEFVHIPSVIALTATPATQAQGLNVQLCATVTNAGNLIFTSIVQAAAFTFYDGNTSLGLVLIESGGKACLNTATLSLGSHSITAHFSGEYGFLPGTSRAVTVTVLFATNGKGGSNGGTGANPPQTGPNGGPTGGLALTGSDGSGSPTDPAPAASVPARLVAKPAVAGLPVWLLLVGILGLLVLVGGAGGMWYRLRTRQQRAGP